MHVSLVICLALFIAVVNCAPAQTSKARKPQSAYAYLRSVRSKNSCASGTCAFWERHGRSFAALRCYSQQYKECVCLHRMCFSSCLFTRQQCNSEMVICLKQICPRCMPASSSSMCQVYDSMAERVADALSVFSCYACCPNLVNSPLNNTNNAGGNLITTTPSVNGGNVPTGNTNNPGNVGSTTPVPSNAGAGTNNGGSNAANGARPNNTNAARPNNANGNTANFGGVIPGSGPANIGPNLRNNSNTANNANVRPNQNQNQNQNPNQQVRQATRAVTKRTVTTRRKTVTTRRPATTTTRRSNTNKNTTGKPIKAQKQPQLSN
ncbi:unnamed protein product [Adineta ricciae]|uniref:Uncharacterized protein n=1 Tax=Adineta ricciae TaxID=249248 RepID=A0A815NPD3_ADIRI|nr:unnamed protein product [Adineta ricciae]